MSEPMTRRQPDRWRALTFCVVICCLVGLFAAFSRLRTPDDVPSSNAIRWAAVMHPTRARAVLAKLPVVERSPEVAYDREADFGRPWIDIDENSCDTRNDILARDLTDVRYRPDSHDCVVASGVLVDPYTGSPMAFDKSDAGAVQIDHLIPLHAAWQLGAWRWSATKRMAFANDPRELLAVSGPANQEKSDALADRWRPANERVWCTYAINTVGVHATYQLGVTAAERSALTMMLGRCG